MTVNGPDPVSNPELVLLLDGGSICQEASDDYPEQKSCHDHDQECLHHISPVGSERGVLWRLLVVARQDAQSVLQQLHRGASVSSKTLGCHESWSENKMSMSFIRDLGGCNSPEVDIYELHRTCSLKEGFKSLDLSVGGAVTITGLS